jgi:preprotein translocase subunit YajC
MYAILMFAKIGFLMLVSGQAFAQAQPSPQAAAQPATWEMLMMPAGFLASMYIFMIRPQQKRAKEHRNFLGALKAGDEVVTTGGIIGRIKTVQDTFVSLEVASNTIIKVVKSEVSGSTNKQSVVAPQKA